MKTNRHGELIDWTDAGDAERLDRRHAEREEMRLDAMARKGKGQSGTGQEEDDVLHRE